MLAPEWAAVKQSAGRPSRQSTVPGEEPYSYFLVPVEDSISSSAFKTIAGVARVL